MDQARLIAAFSTILPQELAEALVGEFVIIRQDAATKTLGRTAPGKFVETLVQVLQNIGTGEYDAKPDVEDFLAKRVENLAGLDDGLRICAARIGRAAYALRSKRNIAHKGEVDPNSYDLELLHAAARWAMAELLRHAQDISMEEAGSLIDLLHVPVGRLVEEVGERLVVHGDLNIWEEVLIVLHHHHPDPVPVAAIIEALNRRKPQSVRNELRPLWDRKLIDGEGKAGYRLTTPGINEAVEIALRYDAA